MSDRVVVEQLFEDCKGNEFWWKQCEKPECSNYVCLSKSEKKYCYPHSKWYRKYIVAWRKIWLPK